MTKGEVIRQYNQDGQLFLETLKKIPPGSINDKFLNDWGLKEITAHIAAWNLETINGIEMVLEGKIPWFFDDEEQIDSYNSKEVKSRESATLEENLREIEITHQRLITFLEKIPDDSFHQGFGRVWKTQDVTPSLVCSYRHYLHHTKDILEWLGQTEKED